MESVLSNSDSPDSENCHLKIKHITLIKLLLIYSHIAELSLNIPLQNLS